MKTSKKIMSLMIAIALITITSLVFAGCGGKEQEYKEISLNEYVHLKIPADWEEQYSEDGKAQYDIPDGGLLQITYIDTAAMLQNEKVPSAAFSKIIKKSLDGIYSNAGFAPVDESKRNITTEPSRAAVIEQATFTDESAVTYEGNIAIKCDGTSMCTMIVMVPQDDYSKMKSTIDKVTNSLSVQGTSTEAWEAITESDSSAGGSSSSSASPSASPSTGTAGNPAKGTIESSISSLVKDNIKDTDIESIIINDDASSGSGYIAIVNLTWNVKNTGPTAKRMLSMYSEDLAARVADKCPSVNEIAIMWTVPYLNGDAKVSYVKRGSSMYQDDEVWIGFN